MKGSLNGLGLARRLCLAAACSAIFWLAWRTDLKAQSAANSASDHPLQVASVVTFLASGGGRPFGV
jgi:hypothetical protein